MHWSKCIEIFALTLIFTDLCDILGLEKKLMVGIRLVDIGKIRVLSEWWLDSESRGCLGLFDVWFLLSS